MSYPLRGCLLVLGLLWSAMGLCGGGGVLAEDRCVVEMGFMSAHLTIYQPDTRGNEQFCDTLPDLTDTVLVLDYLHESLNQAPLEVRIIENATGQGRWAGWNDVEALDDLEALTVFHRPLDASPGGALTLEHRFEREGEYLLLITAHHPTKDVVYRTVAPLAVGGGGGGLMIWLLPVLALLLAVAAYAWRRRVQAAATGGAS